MKRVRVKAENTVPDIKRSRTLKDIHIEVEIDEEEIPVNVFLSVTENDLRDLENVKTPLNWDRIYNEVVDMRSQFMAPVDTLGCERMPNTLVPGLKTSNPKVYRFQLLISLMLSSQTKDEVNFEAMKQLHTYLQSAGFSDGLCLPGIQLLTISEIDKLICKVGFHNRKASYIKQATDLVVTQFNGDIPNTLQDLVSLPGVGPKMAHLILQAAWNITDGIGIDVHLHRLANQWKWTGTKATLTPEKTRQELEKWLPRRLWQEINPLLVGFGQAVCVQQKPNCDVCLLAYNGLCASRNKKLVPKQDQQISPQRIGKITNQRADLSKLLARYHRETG
ncbi:DNA N-glycosylase and apurinic/apyrimidinic (AP) lyase [Scheffersomyces spartinae]|uniref:Endonuclease III homolog n=1 Tax=Scheffersomyces spartinae TaxID=45513 RepID=A0A9P7VBZ9_9ASCO|nr:DNA N-glycosylase and apurinic/apyrimidinic (AP) lyase [Scheffersomyces spartinae]KAG7195005.1 DNA N-glycosylase and apurinic/apyrimidinic (AP) lyase [Scheffersomyces spartinae]